MRQHPNLNGGEAAASTVRSAKQRSSLPQWVCGSDYGLRASLPLGISPIAR